MSTEGMSGAGGHGGGRLLRGVQQLFMQCRSRARRRTETVVRAETACVGAENERQRRPSLAIFTAGVPGAGKSYALRKLLGLDPTNILDLDDEIALHPNFDPAAPSAIYSDASAYAWADAALEARFQSLLLDPPELWGMDGTGTKVQRTRRRMRAAQQAGCHVILLVVTVRVETALPRNAQRQRVVPLGVLLDYRAQIKAAVRQLQTVADEVVELRNDIGDPAVPGQPQPPTLLTWWSSVDNKSDAPHAVIENFLSSVRDRAGSTNAAS